MKHEFLLTGIMERLIDYLMAWWMFESLPDLLRKDKKTHFVFLATDSFPLFRWVSLSC